jgi:hypothetical protein
MIAGIPYCQIAQKTGTDEGVDAATVQAQFGFDDPHPILPLKAGDSTTVAQESLQNCRRSGRRAQGREINRAAVNGVGGVCWRGTSVSIRLTGLLRLV